MSTHVSHNSTTIQIGGRDPQGRFLLGNRFAKTGWRVRLDFRLGDINAVDRPVRSKRVDDLSRRQWEVA